MSTEDTEPREEAGKKLRRLQDANPIASSSDEDMQRAFRRRGGSGKLDPVQLRVVRHAAGNVNTLRDVANIAGEASQEGS